MTPTNHTRTALVFLVAIALLTAACGGTGGDGTTQEASAQPAASQTDDGASPDASADEALQIWADAVISAVRDHEASIASMTLRPGPRDAHFTHVQEFFGTQGAALADLATALPASPPSGDLLAARFGTFASELDATIQANDALTGNPVAGSAWEYGTLSRAFDSQRDRWLGSCFALQETLTESGLGLLGCVGLTTAEVAARDTFEATYRESFFGPRPDLGGEVQEDSVPVPFDCPPFEPDPLVADIDVYLATSGSTTYEFDDGHGLLQVWVFGDSATAVQVQGLLDRLFASHKGCVAGVGVPDLSEGGDIDNSETQTEFVQLNIGKAVSETVFPEGLAPVISSAAYAKQGNVIAIYTERTTGDRISDPDLSDLVGYSTIGGSREP